MVPSFQERGEATPEDPGVGVGHVHPLYATMDSDQSLIHIYLARTQCG